MSAPSFLLYMQIWKDSEDMKLHHHGYILGLKSLEISDGYRAKASSKTLREILSALAMKDRSCWILKILKWLMDDYWWLWLVVLLEDSMWVVNH